MQTNAAETERKQIAHGKRCVIITRQGKSVWANLYVNARYHHANGSMIDGDITLLRWTGSTVKGAEKWAQKHIASALWRAAIDEASK